MDFSIEKMCRTCMNEEGVMFSMYSMENRINKNQSYAEMLMACASIVVYAEDGLPQHICQHCLKQLAIAFSFKQQCEQSDATLREITKNPTIEFIKEEVLETDNDIDNLFQRKTEDITPTAPKSEQLTEEPTNFQLTEEFLDDEYIAEDIECYEKEDTNTSNVSEVVSKRQSGLKRKSKVAKKSPNLHCPFCDQVFKNVPLLRKHKKMHAKKLTCALCGKEFRSSHGLNYHMKIHNGVKNFECNFDNCNRRFRLKQALEKHLSIHRQEKNHLCSLCGKTYSTYDALHYHLRTHRGERPYLCIHCGKTFKQACHLKSHMWVHSGIKPHVCSGCGKCYTSGHQLKKHFRKYCGNPTLHPITVKILPDDGDDYDEDDEDDTPIVSSTAIFH